MTYWLYIILNVLAAILAMAAVGWLIFYIVLDVYETSTNIKRKVIAKEIKEEKYDRR